MDYVVYRITRSNVGPWGLSRMTERRPMYLSPSLAVPTALTPPVARSLTQALRRIEEDDDVTAVSPDLAARFPPPERAGSDGRAGPGAVRQGRTRAVRQLRGVGHPDAVAQRRPRSSREPPTAAGGHVADGRAVDERRAARRPRFRARFGRRARRAHPFPKGWSPAVVDLVDTGPVLLGAYTIAELTAVDAIVDFLEARPSDDVLAEAVRSLAARQLLLAGRLAASRSRCAATWASRWRSSSGPGGCSTPGRPGRSRGSRGGSCCCPSPKRICLMVRIDALGVHEIGLYKLDETLGMLSDWLPGGSAARSAILVDADALLTGSERSALVTVTEYTAEGSAEIAGDSTDLILARPGRPSARDVPHPVGRQRRRRAEAGHRGRQGRRPRASRGTDRRGVNRPRDAYCAPGSVHGSRPDRPP